MQKKIPEKANGEGLPETKPVQIINDLPEKVSVNFGFNAYAKPLAELIANKDNVWLLKTRVQAFGRRDDGPTEWEFPADKIKEIRETHFRAYLETRAVVNLLRQMDLNEKQIHQLTTLSESIKSTGDEADSAEQVARGGRIELGRSDLDAMVPVPAGEFIFGEGEEQQIVNIEAPFEIDVYPVTNGQFARFIKDGGYDPKKDFWTEAARKFLEQEKITQPRYWNDEKGFKPDHPVAWVTWDEAVAYARWAGKRLPTEIEWERAARGTDGRKYPWEGDFDKGKCNTIESGFLHRTPVTRYPTGISPVGCYDMAGNVVEWTTSSEDDTDVHFKVVRGGCYSSNREYARCAFRHSRFWKEYDSCIGFRCVRTLP